MSTLFKGTAVLLIVAGLYACASTPEAYFASDIRIISSEQLGEYWIAEKETVKFRAPSNFKPSSGCGYVVLQYLIDSNGSVFNPEIIESEPVGFYDRTALTALSLLQYAPAETNTDRIPVKVNQKTTILLNGQECESPDS